MPSEAGNHNDSKDLKPNRKMALPADPVGIGFFKFIEHLNFST